MSTKKFKLGNADGNNVKGGRNNTRTILTAAGIVAFGAAAGGGGYAAGAAYGHPSPDDEEKPEPKPEEKPDEKPETQDNQQSETAGSQQTAQQTQPQSDDHITEPQPTDTTQTQTTDNSQTQQADNNQPQPTNNDVHEPTVDKPDEVDPDLIAQQIIEEQNIDPYDIDSPTIISVDELATLYRADGSEMLVAAVHTPDGAQYLLADVDGDGYFTDVFDMAGNYVGEAEGNLMASDLEIMVDPNGGYVAHNDGEPQGDDPTNDIINTPNPTNEDIAENSVTVPVSAEDAVSDEELLAQLLEDEGGEGERLIDDDAPDAPDDDDDDDDDLDPDDIIEA